MTTDDPGPEALVYARGPDTPLREVGAKLLDRGLAKKVDMVQAFAIRSKDGSPRASSAGRVLLIWAAAGQGPACVEAVKAKVGHEDDSWCVAMPVLASFG